MQDRARIDETTSANQSPPFENVNLFESDRPLRDALAIAGVDVDREALVAFGADWGSAETMQLGRLANEFPPRLKIVDPTGARIDRVDFHPAYHALMGKSIAAGLHVSCWDEASPSGGRPQPRHVAARAARLYMAYQAEAGHICPITMTHASVAALAANASLLSAWLPRMAGRTYDRAPKPWWEKTSVTLGMGMTERQGGTDVRTNLTQARSVGAAYEIDGQKWFMSAPMCDAFLVLAQAPGGLSCFLLPRFRPDGALNAIRLQRLKDKLGNRSNASSEVEFHGAYAERLGEEGQGVRTIIEMVQWTRLDCAVASAGLMRFGLANALHHARHRVTFGRRLADQPAMRAVLADLALEVEAAVALVFRLASAFERAAGSPAEAALARLATPAAKYLVCKTAPGFLYEALECLGGNGYVEELPLARAYREAPVNAVWEGSGNVMALDVLRAAKRDPAAAAGVIDGLGRGVGESGIRIAKLVVADLLGDEPERHARRLTERLARLAALAALAETKNPFIEV
ncbi:MAG: acyl-CoA dehydrogenase family protein, partial [Methylobacteriaceae bacterium]|nr:acyl-CoA dehydrogenase family protein [Methylobacteriaceae bacterium]